MTCTLTNLAAPAAFAVPSDMAARKLAGALPSLAGTFAPKVGGLPQRCRTLDRVAVRAMSDINVGHTGTGGGSGGAGAAASSAGAPSDAGRSQDSLQRRDDRSSVSRRGGRGRRGGGELAPFGSFLGDLWDPLVSNRSLRQMMDVMDRFFDDSLLFPTTRGAAPSGAVRAPWDVVEDDQAFHIRIDLPGFSKDDVKVTVEGHSLVIQAEKKEGSDDKFGNRSYGTFFTRVELPENIKSDAIKAELKHGVLNITVPKTEEKKQVIDVKVASDDSA